MVISVEISGLLEERLRRLVDLGIYASVAEAVREAVRSFLQSLDLKDIAFNLYVYRDATLQYVSEFAGETYEVMIDYMISRGVVPAIGVTEDSDVAELEPGEYVMDGLTLYVAYKSGLVEVMSSLRREGYRFVVPSNLENYVLLLEAQRLRAGLRHANIVEFVESHPQGLRQAPLTAQEAAAIHYARGRGVALITDDARTRAYAREAGVKAYSLASVIYTKAEELGDRAEELAYMYRSVPATLPDYVLAKRRRSHG